MPSLASLLEHLFEGGFTKAVVQLLVSLNINLFFAGNGSVPVAEHIGHGIVELGDVAVNSFLCKSFKDFDFVRAFLLFEVWVGRDEFSN